MEAANGNIITAKRGNQMEAAREIVPLHPGKTSSEIGKIIHDRVGGSLWSCYQAVYSVRGKLKQGGRRPVAKRPQALPKLNGAAGFAETYTAEQIAILNQIIREFKSPSGKRVDLKRAMEERPEWKRVLLKGGRTHLAVRGKLQYLREKLERDEAPSQLPVPATREQHVEEIQTHPRGRRNPLPIAPPAMAIRHCPRCGKPVYICEHCGVPEKECRICGESIKAWASVAGVLQGLPKL